ncbi:CYFA0S02e06304g1_1 [Cyberlindnera fabianii]|uniref:Alpha/beta hydrolase domain-containing protein 11 n=1 Tax=Cyberlindnera fabianii TaxID=36022 RepID=A0A061ANU2_CYBFA|nr:Alpha/beta hydrolase domain-containing protein 11 [Cyberlindnera fabianii]CDR38818.1 CYFA0S02e06304g1_1 [Cyberlindnera fabianii]
MKQPIKSILPSFKKYAASATSVSSTKTTGTPIVFLHGFLGSKKNFSKLARHFNRLMNRDAYTIDARNHGESAHIQSFAYPAQMQDLVQFMNSEKIDKATLVGYSMGAKTAMKYALKHPERVDKMVCIDNAPVTKPIGPEFEGYVQALKNVVIWSKDHIKERNHREFKKLLMKRLLEEVNGDAQIAVYLADVVDVKNGKVVVKMPLEYMDDMALRQLGEWSLETPIKPSQVETLTIKAGQSPFVDNDGIAEMKKLFPRSQFEVIEGATHANILVDYNTEVTHLIENHIK